MIKKHFTFAGFSLKDFSKLSKREQQACWMLLCCTLAFILVVIISSVLIFGGKEGSKANASSDMTSSAISESNYDQDDAKIDTDAYAGTILKSTPDAGQKYLEDTLFVGDSNTVRMYLYELVPLENYMGLEGMGIDDLTSAQCVYFQNDVTVYTIPRAIAKVQPRRVVIGMGTNNADGSISTDAFIQRYRNAISAIQGAYSYCDIIIAAIPPIAQQRQYPALKMANIDEMNKALIALAKELKLPFLNTSEALKDSSGYANTQYFYEDGVHYSAAGVKKVLEYVRTHAYETKDRRPSVQNVPARQAPPEPPASSSVSDASSSSNTAANTVKMPPLEGQTKDSALAVLQSYDLTAVVTEEASDTVAAGNVMRQNPASGTEIVVKSTVSIVVSSGKKHVHQYTQPGDIVTPATCTTSGKQRMLCSCGETQEVDLPALGHNFASDQPFCLNNCGTANPNYNPPVSSTPPPVSSTPPPVSSTPPPVSDPLDGGTPPLTPEG